MKSMIHRKNKKGVCRCIPVIALVVFCLRLAAQTTFQNNITIDDGLINNEVTAIHQDQYGFLWFGMILIASVLLPGR